MARTFAAEMSPEDEKRFVDDYTAGVKWIDLEHRYNYSSGVLIRVLRENGIQIHISERMAALNEPLPDFKSPVPWR